MKDKIMPPEARECHFYHSEYINEVQVGSVIRPLKNTLRMTICGFIDTKTHDLLLGVSVWNSKYLEEQPWNRELEFRKSFGREQARARIYEYPAKVVDILSRHRAVANAYDVSPGIIFMQEAKKLEQEILDGTIKLNIPKDEGTKVQRAKERLLDRIIIELKEKFKNY